MFTSNDSIKFMIAKTFFSLAEFKNYTIKNNISYNYHGKDTIEFNYINKGNCKVKIDNKIYDMNQYSYFVIPEFVPYSIIAKDEIEIYSAYFLIDKKSTYKEFMELLTKVFINQDEEMSPLLKTLENEFKIKSLGYNEIVTSIFKILTIKVIRLENVKGQRKSYWPLDSLQFSIDKILSSEFNHITIKELAIRLNISIRDLQRYLIKNYNKNFKELKKNFKLEYAKNRLEYYDDSIEKISEDLNFSTREHFCYFFKKETNETPLNYRKKRCLKQSNIKD